MTLCDSGTRDRRLNGLLASGQCADVEQAVMMARDAGYLMLKQRSE